MLPHLGIGPSWGSAWWNWGRVHVALVILLGLVLVPRLWRLVPEMDGRGDPTYVPATFSGNL